MTVSIRANRAYPSLPAAGGGPEAHTRLLEALKEAVEVHERRVPNAYLDSFVRLGELVELGLLKVYGDRVASALAGDTGVAVDHGALAGLGDDDHPQYLLVSNAAEAAQDAVGAILANSASVELTYNDATPSITAALTSAAQALLALAETAVQPGDLAAVATSGSFTDLSDTPPYYLVQSEAERFWTADEFGRGHNIIGVRNSGETYVYLPHDLPIERVVTVKDEAGDGSKIVRIY